MEMETEYTVGEAVEAAVGQSWAAWCAQHYPSTTREQAWAVNVKKVIAALEFLKAGRTRVLVTIKGQRPWESETYYYSFQNSSEGRMTLVGKT